MSDLLTDFKRDCADAGVKPLEVFRAVGLSSSAWWRWDAGKFSPRLDNWVALRAKLDELKRSKQDAAA